MTEAAKVIRMSGYGVDTIRDAIQSGMLSADMQRACQRILEDNGRLKRENGLLRERAAVLERVCRDNHRARVEAYREVIAKESEYKQMWDRRLWAFAATFGAGLVLMALATVLVMVIA